MNFLESVGCLAIVIVVWLFFLLQNKVGMSRRFEGALIIATIYAVYLVVASIWNGASSLFSAPSTSTPAPTLTAKPAELTFEAFYTNPQPQSTSAPSCLMWSQITPSMAGRTVCVQGVVVDYRENWDNFLSVFYFGTHEQFFFVSNFEWKHEEIEGKCFRATGEIQLNTYDVPYIKIDDNDLYYCD